MSNVRFFRGKHPQIAADAWIDASAIVIGDVKVGPRSSIWPLCVIRGDVHRIEIGTATNIQDGTILHVSHDSRFLPGGAPVIIHDQVTVGHQAVLHGCEIRDHCLIGIGARVLDRAVLEPRTMVGAGSLVPPGKELEGGYLWVGTPVKRIRALKDPEIEYLDYVAEHYAKLADGHRDEATGQLS
ncbi:gamma carbonic anhydrase family protein [Candidatus Thiosymbion oneisti]|uniref:gamma carbonic anhydrase family protein n=1 Tax=Candidatus Thiosymbion oneisti TaxID=589554 RepID=UPI000B7C8B01|nr:gamma carbonic anhydrase family protein [Candidatus Thiosymbion oneisti]